MATPNNYCGECPIWLADNADLTTLCPSCPSRPQYAIHIPSGSCYPIEPDGRTIIVAGVAITPKIDGKVFWKYSDVYVEKIVKPSDPFAGH